MTSPWDQRLAACIAAPDYDRATRAVQVEACGYCAYRRECAIAARGYVADHDSLPGGRRHLAGKSLDVLRREADQ